MRGALTIAWLRNRSVVLWMCVVMLVLSFLLAAPLAPIRDGILKLVKESPFLQKLLGAVMGLDLQGPLTVKLLVASTWAHPFMLVLVWGLAILGASRFPAEDIEEGYLDAVMGQPLSRTLALAAHSLVTVLGLVALVATGLAGFWLGCRNLEEQAPTLAEMLPVACALLASGILVLGLGSVVSVHCRQRGKVLGALSGLVLWSLVLAYVQPFLPWAASLSMLGLLHYYRPGDILRAGGWPVSSLSGLCLSGLLLWAVAAWRLRDRDL